MKIAMLVTSLFSQGAEYVTASMARGMFAAGHQVDVLVSGLHAHNEKTFGAHQAFELTKGVGLVKMDGMRARYCILNIKSYIEKNRPDVMLCNASPFMAAMVIANLSLPKSKRTKVINVEHSSGIGLDGCGNTLMPRWTLRRALSNVILRQCDAVFTVSEGNRQAIHRVMKYPLDKIYTVYNPAIDEVTDYKLNLPPTHPWLVDRSMPTFVSAGALTGWKNFELLIRAFARVRKERPCHLIIFGEGPRRNALESLLRDLSIAADVSLPGYTNQLPAEIKAADAFVVSSDVESFSIVLVEAMAAGVNIISTDAPYGPPEILVNGKFGRLVPRGDEIALAAAMNEVLDGNGISAPKSRVDEFRIEPIVHRYECALKKVVVNE